MDTTRMMKERIRRVSVLFRELGFKVDGKEEEDGIYSGSFRSRDGFMAGYLIDRECRFVELAFTFQFGEDRAGEIRGKLEEMLAITYDYGCYSTLEKPGHEMAFTIYSKLYYTGLSYAALKDTLMDLMDCVDCVAELLGEGPEDGPGLFDERK